MDIPLLIENKLNGKNDILIFVDAKKKEINKRLKGRKNFNKKIIDSFRKIQKPLGYKKKLSTYVIKNNSSPSTSDVQPKIHLDSPAHALNKGMHTSKAMLLNGKSI